METIIAQNVFRRFQNGRGINDASFSVKAGQCFGVLGSNGSGKTTLTRLIAGLDNIENGALSVFGMPSYRRSPDLRRRCGLALDKDGHWETLTGRKNLTFFARQYGLSGNTLKQETEKLLVESELLPQADEPVSVYSMGMRKKLSIIEALIHKPDLLILDEPSAGVDVAFLDRLAQWIKIRCAEGKTTWVSDNSPEWVSQAATDVILLDNGKIKACGIVSELLDSVVAMNRINILVESVSYNAEPDFDGIEAFGCDGNHIIADMRDDPNLTNELLAWVTRAGMRIQSMEIHSLTLHEAIIKKTKSEEVKS